MAIFLSSLPFISMRAHSLDLTSSVHVKGPNNICVIRVQPVKFSKASEWGKSKSHSLETSLGGIVCFC